MEKLRIIIELLEKIHLGLVSYTYLQLIIILETILNILSLTHL